MGTESDCRLTEISAANRNVLGAALTRLREAEVRFCEGTIPHTPLGRPRVFRVAWYYWPVAGSAPGSLLTGILGSHPWPSIQAKSGSQWTGRLDGTTVDTFQEAVIGILQWTGQQPRRVWRVIRQINAVIAWCEKRAEGRKRDAAEILRQQSPWINKIASEVLLEELASTKTTTIDDEEEVPF